MDVTIPPPGFSQLPGRFRWRRRDSSWSWGGWWLSEVSAGATRNGFLTLPSMGENVGGQTASCSCKAKAGPFCNDAAFGHARGRRHRNLLLGFLPDYTIKAWDSPNLRHSLAESLLSIRLQHLEVCTAEYRRHRYRGFAINQP